MKHVLGKDDAQGLERRVLSQRGRLGLDDLEDEGLDHSWSCRDGTSVYMTQDIGTAIQRFLKIFDAAMTHVGNEQDYHFKVFSSFKASRLRMGGEPSPLGYGMVIFGKMKSREGRGCR